MGSSDKTSNKTFRAQDHLKSHSRAHSSTHGPLASNRSTMPGAMGSEGKGGRGKPMTKGSMQPMSSLHRIGDKKSGKKGSSSSGSKGKDGKSKSPKEGVAAAKQLHIFPRRKAGQEKRNVGSGSAVVLTLEVLQKFCEVPLVQAAKSLGISKTALKSACRNLGLVRWPFRRHCEAGAESKDDGDASVASTASAGGSRSASLGPSGSSTSSQKRRANQENDDNDLGWMCVTPDLSDGGSFEDSPHRRAESESPEDLESNSFDFSEDSEDAEPSQEESTSKSRSPVVMPPRMDLDYAPPHQKSDTSMSLPEESSVWESESSDDYPLHIRGEMIPSHWKPIPLGMGFQYHNDFAADMRMIGV
mmetsp:Transcript_34969/g.54656  ORF Transcript_34969/g.54656 Transcript_34969/m.54656 type:complete len:359 (-) Transcript_34969:171-1247(-)